MADFEYIQAVERDGVHVLYLGDLAREQLAPVGRELALFAEQTHPARLLISFRNVTVLSAPAVGKLLQMIRIVESGGGDVECCEARPEVQELLGVLGRSLPFEHASKSEDQVLELLKSLRR